jgi:hypothetical protein
MILTEQIFGHQHRYTAAAVMGAIAIYILWIGVKSRQETLGTWLGFFSGTMLWTAGEFYFMFFGRDLLGIPPQVDGGEVVQLPEYLVMTSTGGVLLMTLLFFFFNKETRCNFFVWFHRKLGLNMGERTSGRGRNFATITCMETIYVTWTFYVLQLLIYDKELLPNAPFNMVAYTAFFVCLVWGLYLFIRLIKFWRVSSAVRYAIPTSIILWCDMEFLSRWEFFTEVWLEPKEYTLQVIMILTACIIVTVMTIKSPKKPSELETDNN